MPAAPATAPAVGVEPTLISRISMPARAQASAVAARSSASRAATAARSPGSARYAWPGVGEQADDLEAGHGARPRRRAVR